MAMTWEPVPVPLVLTLLFFNLLVVGLVLLIIDHCTWRRWWKLERLRVDDSDLEALYANIRELEEVETALAGQMGMCKEDFDSDTLRLEIKQKVSSNPDYSPALESINRLYRLRRNRSRVNKQILPIKLVPRRLPPGPPFTVDASRFWVVLIGIDAYPDYPLRGCVSDAQLMQKYFMEDLHVPPNRIQLLLGPHEQISPEDPLYPSRTHITEMLLGLATNDEIQDGDNIIIFYSGHGSCYTNEKEGVMEPGYIEAFCPIDRSSGAKRDPVPDISDRELNSILTQISRAKGHRITVILDCCHAGGVSRELPEPGARFIPITTGATVEDMLLAGEKYLKYYPGYRSIVSEDWFPDIDSHVAVAACKGYEVAREKVIKGESGAVGYIGIFTDSLVRALRSGYWGKETNFWKTQVCASLVSGPRQY